MHLISAYQNSGQTRPAAIFCMVVTIPGKIEFARGLVFKRNSGYLRKYGGGSSLERKFHVIIGRQGEQVSKGGSKAQWEFCFSVIIAEKEYNLR